jgi:hypothetical protein
VIASFHLADVGKRAALGALRAAPDAADVPGMRYADLGLGIPLSAKVLAAPQLGRVGLIAAWDDDSALDGFLASHPLAARLRGGWHVRLEPLRASGSWSPLPDLAREERPVDDDEPVAVITLGRLRLTRTLPFLRTSARAEGQAVEDPAVLASTALARPPSLVATFSLWRTAADMRAYAYGESGDSHKEAIRAHRARAFHHESIFARFRPYAAQGSWNGTNPLTE